MTKLKYINVPFDKELTIKIEEYMEKEGLTGKATAVKAILRKYFKQRE